MAIKNYIIEIDRKTFCDFYSERSPFLLVGDVTEYELEGEDLGTLYIKVKRNLKEPVGITTETNMITGHHVDRPKFKTYRVNGKIVGETIDFRLTQTGMFVNNVYWYGKPEHTKVIEKICGKKKANKIYMC